MTRRPLIALACALALVAAACGGSGPVAVEPVAETPDVESLPAWVAQRVGAGDGQLHGVLFGTADHGVGANRISFVVVRGRDNSIVQAATARVYFGLKEWRTAREAQASLVPLGPHSHARGTAPHDHAGATDVYVATVRFPRAGEYWFVVEANGDRTPGAGILEVARRQMTPAVGSRAIASRNPTLADAPAPKITTAEPPDYELLRHTVAGSLRARVPFVLVFATPAFCTSRVCGPTVEVVDEVRRRLDGRRLRFIHIEIYKDNDPARGFNRWVREWRLPTEPWVFLVDRRGVIRAKFEGVVSVEELELAVVKYLL